MVSRKVLRLLWPGSLGAIALALCFAASPGMAQDQPLTVPSNPPSSSAAAPADAPTDAAKNSTAKPPPGPSQPSDDAADRTGSIGQDSASPSDQKPDTDSPASPSAAVIPATPKQASPETPAPAAGLPDKSPVELPAAVTPNAPGGLPAAKDENPATEPTIPPDSAPASPPAPASTANAPAAAPAFSDLVKAAVAALAASEVKGSEAAELRKEHAAIAHYYAMLNYAPLWVADGKPTEPVHAITERLAQAGDDALDLKDVPSPIFEGGPEKLAAAEVALSAQIVAYGRQASGSRVDPQMISVLIGAKPDVADPELILGAVAAAGADGASVLQQFNPQQKPYQALREKLVELRREAKTVASAAPIPVGPSLRVGMSDPRVPLIRARFGLDPRPDPDDLVYDTQIATAVADFQRANGLRPSGVLTTRTLESLAEASPSRVENEIIANMERWRWMPRDLGASRIEVNIPDFEVSVILDGDVVLRNKVIVGKPDTPTPIFSNKMKFVIVNPIWNVPPSILRKEMLPHLGRDPYYLERMGFQVFRRHGQLVVRQLPGERNALGRIKFMFPNQYSVYLHDTPQRNLFASAKRAFSHGCVRVDQPFDFAETVLGDKWPRARLKKLIGGSERYVFLPKPLPIHIEYFTAYVDDDGSLQTREDIYGYSRKVKEALGLEG